MLPQYISSDGARHDTEIDAGVGDIDDLLFGDAHRYCYFSERLSSM